MSSFSLRNASHGSSDSFDRFAYVLVSEEAFKAGEYHVPADLGCYDPEELANDEPEDFI